MNRIILILLPLILLGACKQKKADVSDTQNIETQAVDEVATQQDNSSLNYNPIKLPNPCELINTEEIASIFKINAENITVKPSGGAQGQGQENNSSCFFIFEDGSNGGFLLQVMKNPLYGEFDDWASSYIDVLSNSGETSYPDNIQYKYTKIDGLGDGGVYNVELGKLFWRMGQEFVVGIIFRNTEGLSSIADVGKQIAAKTNPRIKIEK